MSSAGPPCWICAAATEPERALAPFPFRRCTGCGFVFRPDVAASVHDVYESGGYDDVRGGIYATEAEQASRDRDARLRLALVRRHAAGGDLLDVGAAGGNFVAVAAQGGFRARGVEPTPSFAAVARQRGADVAQGTLEELALPAGSLDVVTMWHVLEHIPEPVAELQRVRSALRPDGVLVIEVPNAGSVSAAIQGAAWPSLEPDVHVNQFTPDTLRLALQRAGFAVAVIDTVAITPYLPRLHRLNPRHVAARLKVAVRARAPRRHHASAHELLRAVARNPETAAR